MSYFAGSYYLHPGPRIYNPSIGDPIFDISGTFEDRILPQTKLLSPILLLGIIVVSVLVMVVVVVIECVMVIDIGVPFVQSPEVLAPSFQCPVAEAVFSRHHSFQLLRGSELRIMRVPKLTFRSTRVMGYDNDGEKEIEG
ncbi:hypothetical protein Tco_0198932 [Tanacetum coccineum]